MDYLKPPRMFNKMYDRRQSGLWVGTKSSGTPAPLQVPGCILWLDFHDSTTMTFGGVHASGSGQKVSAILDKSPMGFTYTSTAAAHLRYGVAGSSVGVCCDNPTAGAQWVLDGGSGHAAAFGSTTQWTVFFAGTYTNTTGSARAFLQVVGTPSVAGVYYIPSGSATFTQYDSITGSPQGSIGFGGAASELWEFDVNTGGGVGSLVMRRGSDASTFSGTWPTGRTLDAFYPSTGGTDSWYGVCFEMIAYNTRLNSTNRNFIQSYIKARHGTAA